MDMRFVGEAKTFEEIYPKAPFAELIRLTLLAAATLRGLGNRGDRNSRLLRARQASVL